MTKRASYYDQGIRFRPEPWARDFVCTVCLTITGDPTHCKRCERKEEKKTGTEFDSKWKDWLF